MPRVFATGLAPVEHACGLALLGLDLAAPLRALAGICCRDSGPSPAPAATIRPWKGAALCLVRPGLLPSRCRTKRGFDQAG